MTRTLLRNDVVGDEAEYLFRRRVIRFAKMRGWTVFYTPDSVGMTPGEFDLRLIRPTRYVVAELKSQHGKLRKEQKAMKPRYEACPGIETYVWYPSDDWERLLN